MAIAKRAVLQPQHDSDRGASRPIDGPVVGSGRARWRALAWLGLVVVLCMTTWFSASAVIPQLDQEWRLSSDVAAWLTIALQLGFVTGTLAMAVVGAPDAISPRTLIILGSAGAGVVNAGILLADGPAVAVPLRFVTGVCLAAVYPPALKLLATWFEGRRGLALGLLIGALTIGSAAPHLLNGFGGLEWKMVIGATSALTLLGTWIAFLAVREGPHPFVRAPFDVRKVRVVVGDRALRFVTFGYLGHMWELYAMWAWIGVFLDDLLTAQVDPSGPTTAFVTFGVIAGGSLGCWLGGFLGDRWGRAKTTIAMMAASGSCALTVALAAGAAPTWFVLTVVCLWGITIIGDSAQFSTLATEVARRDAVGTALTLQLGLGFALTAVTIWLVSVLAEDVGWGAAFGVLALGPAAGVVSMLRFASWHHPAAARTQ